MQEFFISNRERFSENLSNGEMAVVFSGNAPKSNADSHHEFIQNKNFFYLTGLEKEEFVLTIAKKNDLVTSKLYIEKPDYDVEKWVGRKMLIDTAKEISGIEDIAYVESFKKEITGIIYMGLVDTVYFDLEKLSWDEPDSYAHLFAKDFRDRFLHVNIDTFHNIMCELRMVKSEFEIDQMREAIEITNRGLDNILDNINEEQYEYQIQSDFDFSIRSNGAIRNSFPTIAASGKDAVILHYVENSKKVIKDSLVLLDLGAEYNQYSADISRTYPVSGKFTPRQKELYNIVLKAQDACIKAAKPGITLMELNEVCKATYLVELKKIGLIEKDEDLGKYYYHGVGHHLGLDTHDISVRGAKLEAGMVITCEPGLYIAEEEIGIRIEDDLLITEDGNINLSEDIIKSVEDIEAYIANRK